MFEPSRDNSELRHTVTEIAAQAVSENGAQGRLNAALTPLLPGLRHIAGKEHEREIKSFVNPARIDITVEVHLVGGEVMTVTTPVGP